MDINLIVAMFCSCVAFILFLAIFGGGFFAILYFVYQLIKGIK
jgi:hypothetical protein